MKKQSGYWKGVGTGLLLTVLVLAMGVTAAATSRRTIEVEDDVRLSINGASFIPRDADGKKVPVFIYNGTTYAPVRALGEAAGMEVAYDADTNTVRLKTGDYLAAQKSESAQYITSAQAKEIALEDAGVKASRAVFLKVNLDWDDGRAEYEVEFYSGNTEYDYEIDAATGAVLSADRDLEDFDLDWDDNHDSGDYISAARAREIALSRAGSGAAVVKCELDQDDGRTVYELELRSGRMEYECDIDAVTGTILQWESDYDD